LASPDIIGENLLMEEEPVGLLRACQEQHASVYKVPNQGKLFHMGVALQRRLVKNGGVKV
jgi:hypothetical protein